MAHPRKTEFLLPSGPEATADALDKMEAAYPPQVYHPPDLFEAVQTKMKANERSEGPSKKKES